MLSTLCHFHGLLFARATSSDGIHRPEAHRFNVELADLDVPEEDFVEVLGD